MGPGEALSVLGACAVLIALFALAFATFSRRLAFKQRKLELEAEMRMAPAGSTDLIARLEKRVRVLERLATDRGQDVAHQIEALREDRRIEAQTEKKEELQ
jgi:hypothetical protein